MTGSAGTSSGGPDRRGHHGDPARQTELVRRLVDAVGPSQVLTDPALTLGYTTDWTGRFTGRTKAVVRPASTAEVAAVLETCRELGVPLVPQGGNTGLVGGGVPMHGEVLLSLRRLAGAPEVDTAAGQLEAGAGTTIGELQRAAAGHGLRYAVDVASRDSATVGGGIATNAGGLRVMPYGDTRRQLLGIEAVLGDGTVISHLGGLTRDNTGYHLPSLLAGSEGTLGVVTRARLRLVPAPRGLAVALVGLQSLSAVPDAAALLRRGLPGVQAIELMTAEGLDLVRRTHALPGVPVGSAAAVLLVEAEGADPLDELAEAVSGLTGVRDAALADDPAGRARLWAWRELHTDAINRLGAPIKLDVALPPAHLAEFLDRAGPTVRSAGSLPRDQGLPADQVAAGPDEIRLWVFGHIGEGCLHLNVTGAGPAAGHVHAQEIEDAVFGLVAELGGSISAEHGIGTAKLPWLHLARTPAELEAFRSIKTALDPAGILNPNALIPRR